jgi:hypothetical protein
MAASAWLGSQHVSLCAPQTQANKQAFARKVRESVLTSLMPEMYKYLTKKDSDGDVALRVPVAVAITRLLQALDEAALHKELPKLVVKVTYRVYACASIGAGSVLGLTRRHDSFVFGLWPQYACIVFCNT